MKVTFKKLLLDKDNRILKKLPVVLDMDMVKSFQQNNYATELKYADSEETESHVNVTIKWTDGESEQLNLVIDDVDLLYELLDNMFSNFYNSELMNEEEYEDEEEYYEDEEYAEEEIEEEVLEEDDEPELPFPESSNMGEVRE
jgi:hypothetical protein